MNQMELICGFPQAVDAKALLDAIEARAEREQRKAVFRFCRSKIEVEHAVACAGPGSHVVLQELMVPVDPYRAWELSALRDIREIEVTVSLSRKHFGSSYLAVLYGAGILDAVYEEEATASCIAEHIFTRRDRKACRDYYGITIEEAMGAAQIMEQPFIKRYMHYIGTAAGQEEMVERYEEIAGRLDRVQKQYLALQLPQEFKQVLRDHGCKEWDFPAAVKRDKKRKKFNIGSF